MIPTHCAFCGDKLCGSKYHRIGTKLGVGVLLCDTTDSYQLVPTAAGVSQKENGESCYTWQVFNRKDVEALYGENLKDNEDLAGNLTGWFRTYGGVGRWFSEDPFIKFGRTRVLVKQFRGLDI